MDFMLVRLYTCRFYRKSVTATAIAIVACSACTRRVAPFVDFRHLSLSDDDDDDDAIPCPQDRDSKSRLRHWSSEPSKSHLHV